MGKANSGLKNGLPPTVSLKLYAPDHQTRTMPVAKPTRPPASDTRGTRERRTPIARSMPWIGKGVITSQQR